MSSCGARNDASKIEHNKKQQPENTANNNQIFWAAVVTHMQDARHPIHRVRIPYSKFSSPKTCRNVHESSLKIKTILLPLKCTKWCQKTIDAHAYMVVSKLWIAQTCKRRKHKLTFLVFPLMKFCESLYRCLLPKKIFDKILSTDFFFLIKNMKLYDFWESRR